jgi:hypothetical protein
MIKKGNMTPLKLHSSSTTKFKNTEMVEMQHKEFKRPVFKMTSDSKEDSNNEMNKRSQF